MTEKAVEERRHDDRFDMLKEQSLDDNSPALVSSLLAESPDKAKPPGQ